MKDQVLKYLKSGLNNTISDNSIQNSLITDTPYSERSISAYDSSITQSLHEQPSNRQPSHEQPSNRQPSYEQPSNRQPSHEQPSYSFISGQDISNKCGLTRAAIWKDIKQLQEDGYVIESVTGKGYRLISCPDIISSSEIMPFLHTEIIGHKIIHYEACKSTNDLAIKLAKQGEPEGTVIISEEQTAGRGTLGRKWIDSRRKSILMSIILRPKAGINTSSLVTLLSLTAVASSIDKEAGPNLCLLKWPNDILVHNKKICGVLTESSGEQARAEYVIAGIGINVNQEETDIPCDLAASTSSICIEAGRKIMRKSLAANIINTFEKLYIPFKETGYQDDVLDYFEHNSDIIRKDVLVTPSGLSIIHASKDPSPSLFSSSETAKIAHVCGLTENGQLLIQYHNGHYDTF